MNQPTAPFVNNRPSAPALRRDSHFCDFASKEAQISFERIKATATHPPGTMIYSQGQPSNGVYIITNGRTKLSTFSKDGKDLILRIAGPGEALGLSSCLSDIPQHATAQVIELCKIDFVEKRQFLQFLLEFPEAEHNLVKQLNYNYSRACEQIRSLALARSSSEKLARLLVSLLNGQKNSQKTAIINVRLTHEEIGSMINASRETVTRTLGEFRRSGLISIDHSKITVNDTRRLSQFADERVEPTEEVLNMY
jgi:CRP/FNR family transcriptional regulator